MKTASREARYRFKLNQNLSLGENDDDDEDDDDDDDNKIAKALDGGGGSGEHKEGEMRSETSTVLWQYSRWIRHSSLLKSPFPFFCRSPRSNWLLQKRKSAQARSLCAKWWGLDTYLY